MLKGQEERQECQMGEDGPYCFLQNKNNRWLTHIPEKHEVVNSTENEDQEEVITNVLRTPNDL